MRERWMSRATPTNSSIRQMWNLFVVQFSDHAGLDAVSRAHTPPNLLGQNLVRLQGPLRRVPHFVYFSSGVAGKRGVGARPATGRGLARRIWLEEKLAYRLTEGLVRHTSCTGEFREF